MRRIDVTASDVTCKTRTPARDGAKVNRDLREVDEIFVKQRNIDHSREAGGAVLQGDLTKSTLQRSKKSKFLNSVDFTEYYLIDQIISNNKLVDLQEAEQLQFPERNSKNQGEPTTQHQPQGKQGQA